MEMSVAYMNKGNLLFFLIVYISCFTHKAIWQLILEYLYLRLEVNKNEDISKVWIFVSNMLCFKIKIESIGSTWVRTLAK